jgi:ankyrin repeat protein
MITPFQEDKIKKSFVKACSQGNLKQVKKFITDNEVSSQKLVHYDDNSALIVAAKNGHLDVVKYLLTSPDLEQHANINAQNATALFLAATYGQLHIVQYLLTSPDLKKHADIHSNNDQAIMAACRGGHLNVVRYLTCSNELNDHSVVDERQFIMVCAKNHLDIANFFITEMNIPQTEYINQYLKEYKKKEVVKIFEVRAFNNSLTKELENELNGDNISNVKKIKI